MDFGSARAAWRGRVAPRPLFHPANDRSHMVYLIVIGVYVVLLGLLMALFPPLDKGE